MLVPESALDTDHHIRAGLTAQRKHIDTIAGPVSLDQFEDGLLISNLLGCPNHLLYKTLRCSKEPNLDSRSKCKNTAL
ncbi:hypothetical protein C5167_037374 [Papaver somniferum]|uniref:Uncharacterized protein n=1 Tax=Papaver somniferum TaxID=3469 RepID=A0A4Y7I8P3_PAPSO|nr:hypothetical protein C5167_037374 [Papaver somniferum]